MEFIVKPRTIKLFWSVSTIINDAIGQKDLRCTLPGAFSEPHRHFLFPTCCSWTGPCDSYSYKRPSTIPTRELLKNKPSVLLMGPGSMPQSIVWEHSRVMGRRKKERENAPMQASGFISTGVKGRGGQSFVCSFLFVK